MWYVDLATHTAMAPPWSRLGQYKLTRLKLHAVNDNSPATTLGPSSSSAPSPIAFPPTHPTPTRPTRTLTLARSPLAKSRPGDARRRTGIGLRRPTRQSAHDTFRDARAATTTLASSSSSS